MFYGGLVRTKNMLSVLMQVFVTFSLVIGAVGTLRLQPRVQGGQLQCIVGGFSHAFLTGIRAGDRRVSMAATFSKNTPMYELVYVVFQPTFAAITCCLILGALRSASSSPPC